MAWYKREQRSNTDVNSGYYMDVETGALFKVGGVTVTPAAADFNKLTTMTMEASQVDAMVSGPVNTYRTQHTAAVVETGVAGVCVPAVAGKRFQVLSLAMRAYGGAAANAVTVEIYEETAATVFLSHIIAHLADGVWCNDVAGAGVVLTGMTAGGMTSAANKGLHISATGGAGLDTCTGIDVIVLGYYTTT
jgi:hypothetical protein